MFYFAYGSNMSQKRIIHRLSHCASLGVHVLKGHRLKFHKVSVDGSAKCDAVCSGRQEDAVFGVVFEINALQLECLNGFEGLGYIQKQVMVLDERNRAKSALIYVARDIDGRLKPYTWYKKHVLLGALENHFPQSYIEVIEQVEAIEDRDIQRVKKELALYSA